MLAHGRIILFFFEFNLPLSTYVRNSANRLSRCACVWLICVSFINDKQGENMYVWRLRLEAAASGVLMTLLECAKWLNSFRLIRSLLNAHGQFKAIFGEFRINFANRFAHLASIMHESSLAFGINEVAAEKLFNYEVARQSRVSKVCAGRPAAHRFSCVIAMRPPRYPAK